MNEVLSLARGRRPDRPLARRQPRARGRGRALGDRATRCSRACDRAVGAHGERDARPTSTTRGASGLREMLLNCVHRLGAASTAYSAAGTCSAVITSSTITGQVQSPVASRTAPTSAGPAGGDQVADAHRHRGHPRHLAGVAAAQHRQDQPEPERAALADAEEDHPQQRGVRREQHAEQADQRGADDHRQQVRSGTCARAASTGIANAGAIWTSWVMPDSVPGVALAEAVALEDLRQPGDRREERHRLQAHEERDRPRHRVAPQRLRRRRRDRVVGARSPAAARRRRRPARAAPRSPAPPPSRRTRRSNGIAVKVATSRRPPATSRTRRSARPARSRRPRAHPRGRDDLRQRDRRARQQRPDVQRRGPAERRAARSRRR